MASDMEDLKKLLPDSSRFDQKLVNVAFTKDYIKGYDDYKKDVLEIIRKIEHEPWIASALIKEREHGK